MTLSPYHFYMFQFLPDSSLSNPLSKRLKHFGGSIRNLVYRTVAHGLTAPHILQSEGLVDVESDFCQSTSYCANGGYCFNSNRGPQCECKYVDYHGLHCEIGNNLYFLQYFYIPFKFKVPQLIDCYLYLNVSLVTDVTVPTYLVFLILF